VCRAMDTGQRVQNVLYGGRIYDATGQLFATTVPLDVGLIAEISSQNLI
jgi:hypothetical protein